MAVIESVYARQILDSRGNPTVEVVLDTEDGAQGLGLVPSGASTGEAEAWERRDGDKAVYQGKGVLNAVKAVNEEIAPKVIGMDAADQRALDEVMIELDGTPNKGRLGANAILGVSLAAIYASAESAGMPLYRYLGGTNGHILPVPNMNIMNGGAHADFATDIQEYMISPYGFETYSEALRAGVEVYHTLKSVLKKQGLNTGLGDEGGFAPKMKSNEDSIKFIMDAISAAGYEPGKQIGISLDVASSEFYNKETGKYRFDGEERFAGHGVSYCATCDGMFYRDKHVFVIGGGNSAAEEALFLARLAAKVTLIVRKDHLRAQAAVVRELEQNEKVELRLLTSIVALDGGDLPSSVTFRDNATGSTHVETYEEGSFGVFVLVGRDPETELVRGLADVDDAGYVVTDERMATRTPGLFVAGDARVKPLRQIVTAASDGAVAATSAAAYLGLPVEG